MTPHWSDALRALGACDEAVEWASTQPDAETAWAQCRRADWMLWIAGRVAGPSTPEGRGQLVLAACACARTALRHVPDDDVRPLRTIETAEAWARGEASLDDVRAAAYTAAAYSANAAAYAAYAAAYAAYAAYGAANAAAYAAAYAAYDAARLEAIREIGRAHV